MINVLLVDSGAGGVNILCECVRVCPRCNYLLFCDHFNLPYGEKSKSELVKITEKNLDKIESFFKFDIVIFACNTLTATVIDEMRDLRKNVIFIGTVPAIKPALAKFPAEDVLLVATKTTTENNKLFLKYKDEINFLILKELASLIDENLESIETLSPYLKKNLAGDFKALVLGCTHYLSVANLIKEIHPNVKIFDSANGVARRLLSFVDMLEGGEVLVNKKGETTCENFNVQIMCDDDEMRAKFWWYYFKKINEN